MYRRIILALCLLLAVHCVSSCNTSTDRHSSDSIPYATRVHWMRVANQALSDLVSPCPFAAFGTAIVNHTGDGLGELICIGANKKASTGNPTMHGEIAAITNCTAILTATNGSYRLSPGDALIAFNQFSLYTNAESCAMCASAIRWARFKEYIYGTSLRTLLNSGWHQIEMTSKEIFLASDMLEPSTRFISNFLSNETDHFFKWQYNPNYPCPTGCRRTILGDSCEPF